jgi:hypothetical protein
VGELGERDAPGRSPGTPARRGSRSRGRSRSRSPWRRGRTPTTIPTSRSYTCVPLYGGRFGTARLCACRPPQLPVPALVPRDPAAGRRACVASGRARSAGCPTASADTRASDTSPRIARGVARTPPRR